MSGSAAAAGLAASSCSMTPRLAAAAGSANLGSRSWRATGTSLAGPLGRQGKQPAASASEALVASESWPCPAQARPRGRAASA